MCLAVNGTTVTVRGGNEMSVPLMTLLMIPCERDDEDLGVRDDLLLPVM